MGDRVVKVMPEGSNGPSEGLIENIRQFRSAVGVGEPQPSLLRIGLPAVGSRAFWNWVGMMNSDDAGASGLSILVVESDPAARVALLDHLRRRGFSILESEHGGASIRAACDRPFDYVVTDIDWSGVSDGSALARWITANQPEARVILTSTSLTHWFPADSKMAGLPILKKPFRQEDLERLLSPVAVTVMPGS